MPTFPDLQAAVEAAESLASAATAELDADELNAWNAFEAFCSSAGHDACPAGPHVIELWLSSLTSELARIVTADAVGTVHLQRGFNDPIGDLR